MPSTEDKLALLSQIAREFNHENLTWAVGASILLYFKGISSAFHDIDIMVAEEDVDAAKAILSSLAELQPATPNTSFKTKYFLEFSAQDIELDVIAGFVIAHGDTEYYFPLEKGDIKDATEIGGVRIPLHSLSAWRTYYKLMGRNEKARLIDEWLQARG